MSRAGAHAAGEAEADASPYVQTIAKFPRTTSCTKNTTTSCSLYPRMNRVCSGLLSAAICPIAFASPGQKGQSTNAFLSLHCNPKNSFLVFAVKLYRYSNFYSLATYLKSPLFFTTMSLCSHRSLFPGIQTNSPGK